MDRHSQRGVGLMEVLVALFLLAIGILGFSALQIRAISASQEAVERSAAMNVARDLAERIRINKTALVNYKNAINNKDTEKDCVGSTTGYKPNCNAAKMAKYDAAEIIVKADTLGQNIKIYDCIGSNLNCIYVAWGRTNTKTDNIDTNANKCVDSSTGTYLVDSQCLVMEAF